MLSVPELEEVASVEVHGGMTSALQVVGNYVVTGGKSLLI